MQHKAFGFRSKNYEKAAYKAKINVPTSTAIPRQAIPSSRCLLTFSFFSFLFLSIRVSFSKTVTPFKARKKRLGGKFKVITQTGKSFGLFIFYHASDFRQRSLVAITVNLINCFNPEYALIKPSIKSRALLFKFFISISEGTSFNNR